MKHLLSILIFFSFMSVASAEIIELKCKPEGYNEWVADIKIAIEENWMQFGEVSKYKITSKVDGYITGVEETYSDKIGGEILVVNRISGEYFRGGVGNFCVGSCADENFKVNTANYKGICKKHLF